MPDAHPALAVAAPPAGLHTVHQAGRPDRLRPGGQQGPQAGVPPCRRHGALFGVLGFSGEEGRGRHNFLFVLLERFPPSFPLNALHSAGKYNLTSKNLSRLYPISSFLISMSDDLFSSTACSQAAHAFVVCLHWGFFVHWDWFLFCKCSQEVNNRITGFFFKALHFEVSFCACLVFGSLPCLWGLGSLGL